MALYHVATIVPTKAQLIADWVPDQPWGPPADSEVKVIGAYRFDDPEGRVGMESFLVNAGDLLLHVPLTYRDAPLEGADEALIVQMEHSVLGTRWVYDGLRDPVLTTSLAATTLTGQGEAIGMAEFEGRWYVAPSTVRISGGGWSSERVPVDGFAIEHEDAAAVTLGNDRFELVVARRPSTGPRPPIALTATWADHPDPVVLAEIRLRSA